MRKILITGHKGFVGRHLKQHFSDYNTEFTLIDINGGIDAREFFKKDDTQFDMVFHCAALVGGRLFIENAPLSVALDLSIDAEFFNWVIRTRPKAVAYFSSSAAYPIELQTYLSGHKLKESDIDLNNIKNPDYTYGWAKLTGEYLANFALDHGINVKVFRPFSGYGSDQDLAYPFPSFILRGKLKENPFQIWGNGEQVRDWIHIDDIVRAIDEAFKQDVPGPINLGMGRPTNFIQLALKVQEAAGYRAELQFQSDMPSGVMYRVSDNSKLLSFYTPKITLEEGITRALKV